MSRKRNANARDRAALLTELTNAIAKETAEVMGAAPDREPSRFATYPGKAEPVGEVLGPNEFGEWLVALEADYDPEANTTRVGFGFARTPDVVANNARVDEQLAGRARVAELFLGVKVAVA